MIGSSYIWLKETDSTNSEAMRRIQTESIEHGWVILAEKQTMGRGQRGNSWQSEASENLTMSIVLFPEKLAIKHQFSMNMCVALGIHNALNGALGSDLKLKWTNDIYYKLKKLGGILIENAVQKQFINNTIIGIGLNVHQQVFDKALPNPVSLHQITGKFYDLQLLAEAICQHIDHYYTLLMQNKREVIRQEYLNHLLWKNEWQDFELQDGNEQEIIPLKIIDVAPNGLLITETRSGKFLQFAFGQLKAVI